MKKIIFLVFILAFVSLATTNTYAQVVPKKAATVQPSVAKSCCSDLIAANSMNGKACACKDCECPGCPDHKVKASTTSKKAKTVTPAVKAKTAAPVKKEKTTVPATNEK